MKPQPFSRVRKWQVWSATGKLLGTFSTRVAAEIALATWKDAATIETIVVERRAAA
jgi:hypothetical protein